MSDSYDEFDFEGGYEPGSILVIKDGRMESPILTYSGMMSKTGDAPYLEMAEPAPVPGTTLDWKQKFSNSLQFSGTFENLSPELKNSVETIRGVKMIVEEGERHSFKKGSIALTDLIFGLSKENLQKIQFQLSINSSNVYMITEVIKYKKAKMEFSWGTDLANEVQIGFKGIVNFGDQLYWNDEGKLIVEYNTPVNVKFKKIPISDEYRSLIKQRIEEL